MTDIERVIKTAESLIGKNGVYVCKTELKLNSVVHWCAYATTLVFKKCGLLGKAIKDIEGGAGDIPRYSDGIYGSWFKKFEDTPRAGDLIFFRYGKYPDKDKYFCDHVGIVKSFYDKYGTITTLEGNVQATNSDRWAETSTYKQLTRYISNSDVYAFYRPNYAESPKTTKIKKGDKVKVIKAIQYDNGKPFYADNKSYDVIEVVNDRVVIARNGYVISAVKGEYLQKAEQTSSYYTVQGGDTLYWIAKKYGMTLNELIKLNPQIENPDLIYVGQEVKIK